MKNVKKTIQNYAEELYSEYDSEGKKIHSLREIIELIKQKFNKNYTHCTIRNWAAKFGWDESNAAIKQLSISKAVDEKFTTQEKIIETKSDEMAKDYKNAQQLANVGYKIVLDAYQGKEHEIIKVRDAISAIKLGTDIKFRILDIPNPDTDHNIIINNLNKINRIDFTE